MLIIFIFLGFKKTLQSFYRRQTWILLISGTILWGGPVLTLASDEYKVAKWTTEQGLPQNTITKIIQTRDGYLWLGTFGGLVRFDGIKFTVFNTVNAPELKNQRINTLYEDRSGTLWIGSESGDIIRYRDGQFSVFKNADRNTGAVIEFFLDSNGFLWVGSVNELIKYSFDARGVLSSERVTLNPASLIQDSIRGICEDSTGSLWFSSGKQLFRYRNGSIENFTHDKSIAALVKDSEISSNISDLVVDRQGVLRIASTTGIARFDGKEFITEFYEKPFKDSSNVRLAKDFNDRLWVNLSDGIAQLVGERWIKYPVAALKETASQSMLIDREGNMWIGTIGQGLWRLNNLNVKFFGQTEGLTNGEANTLLEDKRGRLWLAGRGLYAFHDEKPQKISGVPDTHFVSLGETGDGVIWIGLTGGIYSLDGEKLTNRSGEFLKLIESDSMIVKSIFEDRRKAMWFGLDNDGLVRFYDGRYEHLTTKNGLVDNTVHFITEDRHGALWFGTLGGVSRYENNQFTNYTTGNGLSNNTVRTIYEDRDGAIWFGTYGGGLIRLKDGRFSVITTRDGLFDDVVSRLIADEYDNFWMLGNRGIFVVERQALNDIADGKKGQLICRSYGVEDGMLTSEGNGGNMYAGWRTRDGRFWFPTIHGYAVIIPAPPNAFRPPTIIEEALIESRSLDLTQPFEINPGQRNLEIRYTGLSFIKPELVRFKYKMEGFDPDWIEAGTRRAAYYSYLPPGDYTFMVIAANADGIWNTDGASVKVRVLPPFYQTWWFRLLSLLGILGFIYAIYHWRVSRLEHEKRRQQDFSRRLLESQEQERKRLAAELHDSLSQNLVIIKNKARMSLKNRDDAESAFEQIEEIAEAAGESLNEVSEIVQNLRPFQIDRLGFTKAVAAIIKKADSANLRFMSRLDEIDGRLSPEKEINLFRIIQEAVNNIIKHSQADHASVFITSAENIIEIIIGDNGQGFNPNAAGKSAAGGLGLMGINERARAVDGVLTISSSEGTGTEIRLVIYLKSR